MWSLIPPWSTIATRFARNTSMETGIHFKSTLKFGGILLFICFVSTTKVLGQGMWACNGYFGFSSTNNPWLDELLLVTNYFYFLNWDPFFSFWDTRYLLMALLILLLPLVKFFKPFTGFHWEYILYHGPELRLHIHRASMFWCYIYFRLFAH